MTAPTAPPTAPLKQLAQCHAMHCADCADCAVPVGAQSHTLAQSRGILGAVRRVKPTARRRRGTATCKPQREEITE